MSLSPYHGRRFYADNLSKQAQFFYVNGKFVPPESAMVSVRDLGILRGFGCFDYFRTYSGNPITLMANVKRLRSSCTQVGLAFPWTDEELGSIIKETLKKNNCNSDLDWGIRVIVSGGTSASNIIPDSHPTLIIIPEPIPSPTKEMIEKGVKVITVDLNRVFPTAKTTNYLTAVVAQQKARNQGASEAIYLHNNLIYECTTSNIFIFSHNTLRTPGKDILPGVTRSLILDLAQQKSFKVEIGEIKYESLLKAEEVFLTSANKRILPVVNVDDHIIGSGSPGKITKTLLNLLNIKCGYKEE
jgi:branched-chain amino acid aminotransferase